MNLSAPKGESLNEAIDELKLEQVFMSTAKKFGYSVIDCGHNASMWKWDLVDAYKNIPVPISSLRYQGFRWLGKSFVETQKIFGDKDSVAAFDRLNHTAVDLAGIMSNIPDSLVHRTLDDTPLVTPAHWTAGHTFADAYEHICSHINAKLAPPCPKQEKTFANARISSRYSFQHEKPFLVNHICQSGKSFTQNSGSANRRCSIVIGHTKTSRYIK